MATQVQTKSNTWQGSINIDGKANYSVGYTVRTDNLELGADSILSLDELPKIGDRYELLEDDVNYAWVISKSAKQKSPGFWDVTIKVSNDVGGGGEGGGKGTTEEDEPTDDWKKVGATIDVSSVRVSRAAEVGAYLGKLEVSRGAMGLPAHTWWNQPPRSGWTPPDGGQMPPVMQNATPGNNFLAHVGNGMAITNSAMTAFDPPPEMDYSRLKIVITRFHSEYPTSLLDYIDTVNLKPVDISINDFKGTLPPFTAKLQSISGSREYEDGEGYWQVSYEIECDFLFTWRHWLLDQGYVVNNPDMHGNGYDDNDNPIEEDEQREKWLEVAKDMSGIPMQDPVKLDGYGQAGRIDKNYSIYLGYALYPEVDWTPLKFDVAQPIIDMKEN